MTRQQALEFISRYPNALSYVKASHLEELSPLLEVSIEAISCRKEEFHCLPGNTYMPRKETIDKFGQAAEISFNPLAESTRREGDCYIGKSQAMVLGPDGKQIFGDICEYEYDVAVRHEIEIIEDLHAKFPRFHSQGKLNEDKARLAYLALRKTARQRANTGARTRAILSILGMQTGFKDLFRPEDKPDATVTFLFSRIIINTMNEMVLNRMLVNLTAPAAMLFGPRKQQTLLPHDDLPEPEPQEAIDAHLILEEPQQPLAMPPMDPPDTISKEKEIQLLRRNINVHLQTGQLDEKIKTACSQALERHGDDEAYLRAILERLKMLGKPQRDGREP